jgi:TRAP-type uncharacterized transport system fused permease subunit
MIGEWHWIAMTTVSALCGVILLAGGLHAYLIGVASPWQRIFMIAAALCLIKPGLYTDLAGGTLASIVIIAQLLARSRGALPEGENQAQRP